MKSINKKIIVSDFDGTLLTSSNEIPEEVRSAINEYVSCGGIFAVCTGRMLSSILPRVRELGLKGLVVACQGTVIAEIESGKLLRYNRISCEDTVEICRYIESLNYNINVYSDEKFYTDIDKQNEHLKVFERITGLDSITVNKPVSEFILKNNMTCQKLACLVSPDQREELYLQLKTKFKDRFDVTCGAQVLVEVSPLSDNKGEALKFIANYYGVPLDSTVAVGDNLNDLTMIQTAGTGVAVGNAVQGLKDEADFVTVTNNECAVAKIIEKYGYK